MSTSKFRILHLADDFGSQCWEYLTLPDDLVGEHWMDKDAYDWATWSQWTGMLDKNGIEMYTGDIIKADWHWDEPHKIEWPVDYWHLCEYGLLDGYNLEVIGNVYEHGHLLREG